MIHNVQASIGTILDIPLAGEVEAIAFTSDGPFEFRIIRSNQPAQLPKALEHLADWRRFDPQNSVPCYATLYPHNGGTKGLDATGLALETRGFLKGTGFVALVWKRE